MEKVNKSQLGDRIRELRTAAGHTQDDLAAILEQKRQVVSYYENGTRMPNIEQIMTIAKTYNTTTDYLLGITDVTNKLKTADDEAVRICCDYTGISETSIKALNNINKIFSECNILFDFINSVIDRLYANQFELVSYLEDLSEFEKLFTYFDKNLDSIPDDELNEYEKKISQYFKTLIVSQYKLTKSFNRLFDNKTLNYIDDCNFYFEKEVIKSINNINILDKFNNKQQNNNIDDDLPF